MYFPYRGCVRPLYATSTATPLLIVTNERLTSSNQCWWTGVGVVTSRTASCSRNYRWHVWARTYGIKEYLYCYLIHFCNTFDGINRSVSFGFVEKGNPHMTALVTSSTTNPNTSLCRTDSGTHDNSIHRTSIVSRGKNELEWVNTWLANEKWLWSTVLDVITGNQKVCCNYCQQ